MAVILACLLGALPAWAETGEAGALDAALSAVVTRTDGRSLAGLAVIALRGGEVAYKNAFGSRVIDNADAANNLPFETDTRLRIASVSKMFTAIGCMQLAEQGLIDLDADVSNYLGFSLRNPKYPDVVITTRMLLSHTSSLRDGDTYTLPLGETLSEFFVDGSAYYENGAHFGDQPAGYFSYCNLNFAVIATIMEAVSGVRFDVYMRDNVLIPMGIGGSYNTADLTAADRSKLGVIYTKTYDENGYAPAGSEWIAQMDDASSLAQADASAELADYEIGTNGTLFQPQGGLRISAKELSLLMQLIYQKGTINNVQVISEASITAMTTAAWSYNGSADMPNGDSENGLFSAYGLGVHIITSGANNAGYGDTFLNGIQFDLVGHYGDAYGMFACCMIDPATGDGFIYLANGAECDLYSDAASGNYSENWIWEEEIVTALNDHIFMR